MCARISESKFLKPSKSPSDMLSIRFSWTSSFFRVSNIARARCGIAVKWFPPKFKRRSFLLKKNKENLISQTKIYLTYLSSPRNASGSMTEILFSYKVNISNVSRPSKALLWITEILLWLRFKINRWCKFLRALEGTFCNWFCETSSCVSPLPRNNNIIVVCVYNEGWLKLIKCAQTDGGKKGRMWKINKVKNKIFRCVWYFVVVATAAVFEFIAISNIFITTQRLSYSQCSLFLLLQYYILFHSLLFRKALLISCHKLTQHASKFPHSRYWTWNWNEMFVLLYIYWNLLRIIQWWRN